MAALGPAALAMQVVGGIAQGVQQQGALNAQARVDDENARLTLLDGEQQGLQTRKDERMQAGAMLAAMGGEGVQLGDGSVADVLSESAYQRELEVLNIRTRATRESNNFRQAAEDKRKAGRNAILNGIFGAAATALEGAANLRDQRIARDQRRREGGVILGGGTKPVPKLSISGVSG